MRDAAAVAERIKGSISSKQYGYENLLAPLIAEACIDVVPKNPHNFNVDNVRVVKISGEWAERVEIGGNWWGQGSGELRGVGSRVRCCRQWVHWCPPCCSGWHAWLAPKAAPAHKLPPPHSGLTISSLTHPTPCLPHRPQAAGCTTPTSSREWC